MSRLRIALVYAAALCLVAGSAIALRSHEESQVESPVPSVDNAGARGAKALFTYLTETGANPGVLRTDLAHLPADARVVLVLAPTKRLIGADEWRAADEWISAGGTLVYAIPRRVRTQYVERTFSLRWVIGPRPAPLLQPEALDDGLRNLLQKRDAPTDPMGADASPWLPSPLLHGVRSLRVAADDGLETTDGEARPLAGSAAAPCMLSFERGDGELILLAGAELAENRRLSLGDNLRFWLNLAARGRVYFDEFHHTAESAPTRGLLAAIGPLLLQLLLIGAALAFAVGTRFGLPRPLAPPRRRSQGEYVDQLSQLYARARIDGELSGELYRSLRLVLFERLAISAALDDEEVARRLKARTGIDPRTYLALAQRARVLEHGGATPEEFLHLTREFAAFERRLGV